LDTPDELIEPFTTAVSMTLREMAGVEVVVRETLRAAGTEGFADASVILRLTAGTKGWLVLSVPMRTATELTGRVLNEFGATADDSMVQDCIGELANVIAGQAKTLLYGTPHHFTFSTPTVLNAGLVDVATGRWVIRFDSDAGAFALHLYLPS
jgi:CheY-specific phosphatase CheX